MYSRKGSHRLGLSVATLASALPLAAQAQTPTFGAGIFVGYNIQRGSVEWGAEGFATFVGESLRADANPAFTSSGASDRARVGVGPLLQFSVLGTSDPRLTLALHAGSELARDVAALTGELGVSYRPEAGRIGVHVGLVPGFAFLNLAMRYQFLLDEAWFGFGARLMPTYGAPDFLKEPQEMMSISGRVLRAERGRVQCSAALRVADGGEPSPLQRQLGDAWERDAQLEYASIPAFMQLAHELTALRAPRGLVLRALDAIRDEAQHAAGCAALAGRHLRQSVSPTLPEYAPRPITTGSAGLVRLAMETWVDGCLGEGAAALHAARAARHAAPGAAQRLLQRIAVDEHKHAELAWDTLAWALTRAPDEARAALRELSRYEPGHVSEAQAAPGLERYGRLGAAELACISEQHAAESSKRLARMLSA